MTIYVGSLKYTPVFKSHCCAFGRAYEERRYTVRFLFSHIALNEVYVNAKKIY